MASALAIVELLAAPDIKYALLGVACVGPPCAVASATNRPNAAALKDMVVERPAAVAISISMKHN